ncbi:hypothetical protein LDG_5588 [Legionella drancourtii LLAP12]|uniref:Uncharacterized protein n=1 Tax=Legionella drancourtii LLAP12 TaxID=658187 RepID=G9EK65_9GAMM|nr:hypothetical protein LDG_5588 [Legionella drancourtii LLAP12]
MRFLWPPSQKYVFQKNNNLKKPICIINTFLRLTIDRHFSKKTR